MHTILVEEIHLLLLVTPFIYNTSDTPALYYVPPVLHMGVGLARDAHPVDTVITHLMDVVVQANMIPLAIRTVSSIEEKKDEPVLKLLAEASDTLGVPMCLLTTSLGVGTSILLS